MRLLFGITVLLVVAVCLAGCGGGGSVTPPVNPAATGTLSGFVYAQAGSRVLVLSHARATSGSPVPSALVSVRGYPALTALSGTTGAFTIANVPVGSQVLYVSVTGYTRTEYSVTVQQGSNPAVTFSPGVLAPNNWTLLVYMAANNSLDAYALMNFQQMEQTLSASAPVTILVQMTRAGGNGTGTDNWLGTRRYIVQPNSTSIVFLNSELITNMGGSGAVDSGSSTTLQKFVAWGQSYAPAQHYLVDVWDHGSGWDPYNDATSKAVGSRAVCEDDTTGSVMTDVSLSAALTTSFPIDIVAMDDCLMSCAEVAYQIRNQADYLVASEDSTPAAGFNYGDIVKELNTQSNTLTPAAFAQYIASDSLQYWTGLSCPNICMSALDLSKMNAVGSALDTFALRLIAVDSTQGSTLLSCWQQSVAFDAAEGFGTRDLTAYASIVAANVPDSQLQSDAQTLNQAIAGSVVWSGQALGDTQAHGLSIYMPGGMYFRSYPGAISSYGALALAQNTHWSQWLQASPGTTE